MASPAPVEHLWFLDTLVTVHVSERDGTDRISVLEHRARAGASPPLHLHRTEDEAFIMLEGVLRLQLAGSERRVGPGESVVAPKGLPHTYRVESAGGARWLTVTTKGDFERFVRASARPAERVDLPEPGAAPTPEAIAVLAEMAGRYGVEFIGPPLA